MSSQKFCRPKIHHSSGGDIDRQISQCGAQAAEMFGNRCPQFIGHNVHEIVVVARLYKRSVIDCVKRNQVVFRAGARRNVNRIRLPALDTVENDIFLKNVVLAESDLPRLENMDTTDGNCLQKKLSEWLEV